MVGLAVVIYLYELGISIYRCTTRTTVKPPKPGNGNSDSSDEDKRKSDIENTDEKSTLLQKSRKTAVKKVKE